MLQRHCCRTHGAADGDASQLRVTTLAHAELPDRQAYMLFNYVQSLAICEFNKTGQVSPFPAAYGCSSSLMLLVAIAGPYGLPAHSACFCCVTGRAGPTPDRREQGGIGHT